MPAVLSSALIELTKSMNQNMQRIRTKTSKLSNTGNKVRQLPASITGSEKPYAWRRLQACRAKTSPIKNECWKCITRHHALQPNSTC